MLPAALGTSSQRGTFTWTLAESMWREKLKRMILWTCRRSANALLQIQGVKVWLLLTIFPLPSRMCQSVWRSQMQNSLRSLRNSAARKRAKVSLSHSDPDSPDSAVRLDLGPDSLSHTSPTLTSSASESESLSSLGNYSFNGIRTRYGLRICCNAHNIGSSCRPDELIRCIDMYVPYKHKGRV